MHGHFGIPKLRGHFNKTLCLASGILHFRERAMGKAPRSGKERMGTREDNLKHLRTEVAVADS